MDINLEEKKKKRKDSELPWTGLNVGEDKGKGIKDFNHFNATEVSGATGETGGCFEGFLSEDKHDRTSILMYVEYDNPYENKKLEESTYIPTEIFCEAFRKWSALKSVGVDSTDTGIVNFISDLKAWDTLEDDEDFLDICKELYYKSNYFEDDKEEFIDTYEMLHDLGEYAIDDEE